FRTHRVPPFSIPSSCFPRVEQPTMNTPSPSILVHDDAPSSEDDGPSRKSRRELPPGAVAHLKAWLLSPEHFTHPYPTPQDQIMLMQKTGIDKKQLKNWFTNARRRIWKPMLKKQLEAGKLVAHGAATVAAPVNGLGNGSMVMVDNGMYPPQNSRPQPQQQPQQVQSQPQFGSELTTSNEMYANFQQAQLHNYDHDGSAGQQQQPLPLSNSIGSLPPPNMNATSSTASLSNQMIKTDSHAVLMELFARDQYLVRQAASSKGSNNNNNTEQVRFNIPPAASAASSAATAAVPIQKQHSVTFDRVPTLSSWPHFSSVSSLNNLGGIQGVKSITNLSMADLSSQGNLNKMGNLAQVKSFENMGRGDSYAFLEIFFDDKSGMNGSSSVGGNSQRGIKREREDDDAIGLSLDGDDAGTPVAAVSGNKHNASEEGHESGNMPPCAPIIDDDGDDADGGQLKRAYDDALAARGLIAVRRSCEKLTDLALPAKMQRTLSQEYIRQHAQGQPMGDFFSSCNSQYAPHATYNMATNNAPPYPTDNIPSSTDPVPPINSDPSNISANTSVQVPSSTKCALCATVSVDTQLRPCGHMFHGRCLKPSLQNAVGPPKCPMCGTSMQSAILAVPTAAPVEDVNAVCV
ncbi:hypothetical protein HJC23_006031, partial [Cyclotella cryptica]